jgi:hypothetical protein
VLDSEEAVLDSGVDVLDSVDVDGAWVSVSVVFVVSTGVVVAGVVVSAVVVASADLACSLVVRVWVGSVSVVCVVELDDAACGDREAALRAFVEPVEVVPPFFEDRSPARADLSFVPAPFVAALALLPGKACAASSVKAPVSVAEPASSQRLQRPRRRRAASRERLDVDGVMCTYSAPQPSLH